MIDDAARLRPAGRHASSWRAVDLDRSWPRTWRRTSRRAGRRAVTVGTTCRRCTGDRGPAARGRPEPRRQRRQVPPAGARRADRGVRAAGAAAGGGSRSPTTAAASRRAPRAGLRAAGAASTSPSPGNGIGLATCRRIVAAHGGADRASRPAPGGGTTSGSSCRSASALVGASVAVGLARQVEHPLQRDLGPVLGLGVDLDPVDHVCRPPATPAPTRSGAGRCGSSSSSSRRSCRGT